MVDCYVLGGTDICLVIKNAPQPSFVPVIETVRDRVVVVRQAAILWAVLEWSA